MGVVGRQLGEEEWRDGGGKSKNEEVEERKEDGEEERGTGKWETEGIKCDRDRNGNGNIGGVGMTLICGRVSTKGEGKERLVRKRKRRDAERLMSSWPTRSRDTLPGNWAGWDGLEMGMASLEPARRASSVCSLRPRPILHIVTLVTLNPTTGNFIFSNNSIPLAKRLNP
jgi:hypothetical protein